MQASLSVAALRLKFLDSQTLHHLIHHLPNELCVQLSICVCGHFWFHLQKLYQIVRVECTAMLSWHRSILISWSVASEEALVFCSLRSPSAQARSRNVCYKWGLGHAMVYECLSDISCCQSVLRSVIVPGPVTNTNLLENAFSSRHVDLVARQHAPALFIRKARNPQTCAELPYTDLSKKKGPNGRYNTFCKQ